MLISTTDAIIAHQALEALGQTGLRFALLHGEADLQVGDSISDLDIVVEGRSLDAIRRALPSLHRVGLHPIALWSYDVAETLTAFISDVDAGRGVQVDLLSDRRGEGKYGIRSLAVLDHATMGHSWPTVSHVPQILYAIRKRQVKRQHGRLEPLIAEARGIPADELASVAKEIFSFPVARDVLRLIRIFPQWVDPEMVPGYRGRRLLVGTRRLLSPVGFWVEIHGGAEARELCQGLADRFGRFLPYRAASPRPMGLGGEMRWFLRQVAPIRWRPGLIVSWTPRRSRWLNPDLTVEPEGVEQAARKVVQAMEGRLGL